MKIIIFYITIWQSVKCSKSLLPLHNTEANIKIRWLKEGNEYFLIAYCIFEIYVKEEFRVSTEVELLFLKLLFSFCFLFSVFQKTFFFFFFFLMFALQKFYFVCCFLIFALKITCFVFCFVVSVFQKFILFFLLNFWGGEAVDRKSVKKL